MEQRLSVISLGVADVERSKAFYGGLGWSPVFEHETAIFYQAGGLVFALFPGLAEDARVEAERRGPGLIALAHNVRSPGVVDAVVDQARAAGARITKPAQDAPWGGRSAYFADPDGHLWEVAWNPAWPIDAEGRVTFKGG